jgi:hypothetical protein
LNCAERGRSEVERDATCFALAVRRPGSSSRSEGPKRIPERGA